MANNEEKREVYYITKNFDTAKKIGDALLCTIMHKDAQQRNYAIKKEKNI